MLEILKANVLIAYQQLEQYQLDRYGRGVVSAMLEYAPKQDSETC